MLFEEDRSAVHECGHALAMYVLTGRAGQISLKGGGGSCSPLAYSFKDFRFDTSPAADHVVSVAMDVAGAQAEKLIFSTVNHAAALDDYQRARASMKALWTDPDFQEMTLKEIEKTVLGMLRHYDAALHKGVRMVTAASLTDGGRLSHAFASAGAEIASYFDEPLLAGNFFAKWAWWARLAGVG